MSAAAGTSEAPRAPLSPAERNTKYDYALRRRSVRRGRERGCWVYIPAEELKQTGIDPHAAPPFYGLWGRPRGSVLVRLYKEG